MNAQTVSADEYEPEEDPFAAELTRLGNRISRAAARSVPLLAAIQNGGDQIATRYYESDWDRDVLAEAIDDLLTAVENAAKNLAQRSESVLTAVAEIRDAFTELS